MNPVLYNITFKVAHDFLDDWLIWVENYYISSHIQSSIFTSFKLLRIYGGDAEDGVSYAIQFVVEDILKFQKFASKEALEISQIQQQFCGENALSFSTVMEIVKHDNI